MKPGDKVILREPMTIDRRYDDGTYEVSTGASWLHRSHEQIIAVRAEPLELWGLRFPTEGFFVYRSEHDRDLAIKFLQVDPDHAGKHETPVKVKLIAYEIESDGAA